MNQRRLMTPRGYAKLSRELYELKTVERHKIVEEIAVARAHGDLSENAEYHFAKDKQGHIEARVRHLEAWLAAAEVIDPAKIKSEKVQFGATVELQDHDTDDRLRYTIVGEEEAELEKGRLSITSPLARALLGKEVDDTVSLKLPRGTRTLDVTKIEYLPAEGD